MRMTVAEPKKNSVALILVSLGIVLGGLVLGYFMRSDARTTPDLPPMTQATRNAVDHINRGYIGCIGPDEKAKTCISITEYKANGDGSWKNTSIMRSPIDNSVTWELSGPAAITYGLLCGKISQADMDASAFYRQGERLAPDLEARLRAQHKSIVALYVGREGCAVYSREKGEHYVSTKFTNDPSVYPVLRMKWVLPNENYQILGSQ